MLVCLFLAVKILDRSVLVKDSSDSRLFYFDIESQKMQFYNQLARYVCGRPSELFGKPDKETGKDQPSQASTILFIKPCFFKMLNACSVR